LRSVTLVGVHLRFLVGTSANVLVGCHLSIHGGRAHAKQHNPCESFFTAGRVRMLNLVMVVAGFKSCECAVVSLEVHDGMDLFSKFMYAKTLQDMGDDGCSCIGGSHVAGTYVAGVRAGGICAGIVVVVVIAAATVSHD